MALVTSFICSECRQECYEMVTPTRICTKCRIAIAEAKELAHMSRLAALPIEERIRRIEQDLYRLNVDARLKTLEIENVRY